jgi:glycosyltransferase involved in cell wall biosynthesis
MQSNSNMGATVSVIMPAYNSERTIEVAIDSILKQTWKDLELLVVVDPSTDKTVEIVNRKSQVDNRVRLVELKSRNGISVALNEGIRLAKGEFIARMDSDDYSKPERIEKQIDYMRNHPDVDVLGTSVRLMHKKDGFVRIMSMPQQHSALVTLMRHEMPFVHPTVIFRRRFFRKVGVYDTSLRYAEDMDLWWRGYRICKFANLPDVLLDYTLPPIQGKVMVHLRETLVGFSVRWRDKKHVAACVYLTVLFAWHVLVGCGLWFPRHRRRSSDA